MADRKELLYANRAKEPAPSRIFREQRIAPTIPGRVAVDRTAGQRQANLAAFLEKISPAIGSALEDVRESRIKGGIASFKKATPKQRESWANAIKDGTIAEKESPYFREGVEIAYTEMLASEYNERLFKAYEQNPVKNNKESGALEKFMVEFDEVFSADHFGQMREDVLVDHFFPQQQAVRRQLSQRHTEYQNSEYRREAYETKVGQLYDMWSEELPDILGELDGVEINSESDFNTYLEEQDISEETLNTTISTINLIKDRATRGDFGLSSIQEDTLSKTEFGRKFLEAYKDYAGEKIRKKFSKIREQLSKNIPEANEAAR